MKDWTLVLVKPTLLERVGKAFYSNGIDATMECFIPDPIFDYTSGLKARGISFEGHQQSTSIKKKI